MRPPMTTFPATFLERILRLISSREDLKAPWTQNGIILEVGNKVNPQGTHRRADERAKSLSRPHPETRGSTGRIFANRGLGSLRDNAEVENRTRILW